MRPQTYLRSALQPATFTQSSRFLEKADFVRLKNVSLSYDIPKAKLKNTVGMKLFVSATNLFTITGYSGIDPEANSSVKRAIRQGIDFGSYPNAKTYTGGITLSFLTIICKKRYYAENIPYRCLVRRGGCGKQLTEDPRGSWWPVTPPSAIWPDWSQRLPVLTVA